MPQTWQQHVRPMTDSLPQETLPILAGAASFGATLALSTATQLSLLGVSTGSRPPIPTCLGMATVCVASLVGHQAAISTHASLYNNSNSSKSLLQYLPLQLQTRLVQSSQRWVPRQEEWNLGGILQLPMHKVRM